ncbi:MAG: DNA-binding domain-containing protein [Bacteroidales bacterium]|nr:DNA-binding domain-containing protein [Bacteroidales bacterium]
MLLKQDTKTAQSALANYCRTGILNDIPGVEDHRVHHYRRLVFNIIDDSLASAYPLTRNLLSVAEWDELVNEFFSSHPCQSPQVWTMPKEFYEYLIEVNHPLLTKYPFLQELLWMEWLEIEIYMMEDQKVNYQGSDISGIGKLVINPEHRLITLNYPVHLKQASQILPDDRGNYYLIMHREPVSGKVHFTDLSPFFTRMIEHLNSQTYRVDELIEMTARDFGMNVEKMVYENSLRFIENALNSKLILGFTN